MSELPQDIPMKFQLRKKEQPIGMAFKPQYNPLQPLSHRFWVMAEVEAQFSPEGLLTGFKFIRCFKRMEKEDKKTKEEKQEVPKQRRIQVEKDELL